VGFARRRSRDRARDYWLPSPTWRERAVARLAPLTSRGAAVWQAVLILGLACLWLFQQPGWEPAIAVVAATTNLATALLRPTADLAAVRRHAINMRNAIGSHFRADTQPDFQEALRHPQRNFQEVQLLVRSLRDTRYPEPGVYHRGFYSWCGVELYDVRSDDILVWRNVVEGVMDADGRWAVVPRGSEVDLSPYARVDFHHLGLIPYRVIHDFDSVADDYSSSPTIHCSYEYDGTPFAEQRYAAILREQDEERLLDPAMQFELESVGGKAKKH
jgi:antitoxin (DNA-binding transcriptional repressor) of toxin-antitoxin stability system